MKEVGFGTDGWRGVIADGFTKENLGLVTQAVMSYIKRRKGPKSLFVGYDTRFMSDEYARHVVSVAAGNGLKTKISRTHVTTPMLSHAVYSGKSSGGVMVTASHNPAKYNGIKYKPPFGGSAYPEITAGIEPLIGAEPVSSIPFEDARARGMLVEADFIGPYSRDLYRMLDLEVLKGGAPATVMDCMHGAAGAYAERLWAGLGLELKTIRTRRDPYFGGSEPEPVEKNLSGLIAEAVDGGYEAGFATDGDGDRLGVVDGSGRFVDAHHVLGLLIMHLCRNRGMSGAVVKTVSTSSLVDRVAAHYGLPVLETPVGFKHICEIILKRDVLIGGEENGGIGVKGYMPERDGFLAALLVTEMLAREGTGLGELVRDMDERFGKLYYKRHDLVMQERTDSESFTALGESVGHIYRDFSPVKIVRLDGYKAVFGDGSWILFRLSGTEPMVRVYVESGDEAKAERLMTRAREALCGQLCCRD